MVPDTIWKGHMFPDLWGVEETIEVHPFTTIHRPGLAAKSYGEFLSEKSLFKRGQVFANHFFSEEVYPAYFVDAQILDRTTWHS